MVFDTPESLFVLAMCLWFGGNVVTGLGIMSALREKSRQAELIANALGDRPLDIRKTYK